MAVSNVARISEERGYPDLIFVIESMVKKQYVSSSETCK